MSSLPPGIGASVREILFPAEEEGIKDPAAWVQNTVGEFVPPYQQEIMRSVDKYRYTAVHSCHDSGKSFSASRIMAWWLKRYPPGEAFVVTTAPTVKQIHAILWREFDRTNTKIGEPFRITMADHAYMDLGAGKEELVAFGRKPADNSPTAFSGIHARHVLVIIDEAGGISESMWTAVDTLVTNEGSHVLAIGNPDDPASHFAEVCQEGSDWNVIHIDGLRTPNFTREGVERFPRTKKLMEDEGIPFYDAVTPTSVQEVLLSPAWVEERIRRWGTNSAPFASKVRGIFPSTSDDAVISPYLVRNAKILDLPMPSTPKLLAVDVAGSGMDETVALEYSGGKARVVWHTMGADTMKTAGFMAKWKAEHPDGIMVIDYVGLGRGAYDRLREQNISVIGFGGGESSRRKNLYANKRAEAWWLMRAAFENSQLDIDGEDIELCAQLSLPKWTTRSSGQIVVESKDDMRKRGISSPDRGDALSMAIYYAGKIGRRPVRPTTDAIRSAIERMGLRF